MDPITLVVTAVALGASAGLQEAAASAVKDSYAALKRVLALRRVDVSGVERRPESTTQREALRENLADAGVTEEDQELIEAARRVADAVAAHDAGASAALGVDLKRVQAEFLRIRSIQAEGTGLRVEEGTFSGGIDIGDVRAGRTGTDPDPSAR